MRRLYTKEQYLERISWMKAARRPIAITTDIIVGFPGETEKDFEATLELLSNVEYHSLFAFKYSPRPNTAALEMGDHIPEEEKVRRLNILNEYQRTIQIRRNSDLVGTVEEVHVEGRHKSLEQWIGRTSQNTTLNFSGMADASLLGAYVPVRVTRASAHSLTGESVN
jgi:tRNA-2-methylthio-N6-dimethylallyladenosine synthase